MFKIKCGESRIPVLIIVSSIIAINILCGLWLILWNLIKDYIYDVLSEINEFLTNTFIILFN